MRSRRCRRRPVVVVGASLAVAGAVHAAWNLTRLRVPPADPPPVAEPVAVLLPVRDEAHRVEPCLRSLLAQTGVRDLRILVLDDESADGTAEVVRRVVGDDLRVRLLAGGPLPAGWWGKAHACQQLADAASDLPTGVGKSKAVGAGPPAVASDLPTGVGRSKAVGAGPPAVASDLPTGVGRSKAAVGAGPPAVLVFVDADVVLAPHAVASTVALLRWSGLDLLCPYPRQLAVSVAERLVQPLLQWSFLTFLPLRLAERSPRPALSAANGQLLAVDVEVYRRVGGHATVRADPLEDVALLRAVKRAGGRGGVVDGTELATCRMYDGWPALQDGYAKSLWSAFGTPAGAAAVLAGLWLAYVVPPLAALRGSRAGLAGYAAGVTGRVLVGRRVGARVLPDALAHPVSVTAFGWLTARSVWRRARGTITAAGRPAP